MRRIVRIVAVFAAIALLAGGWLWLRHAVVDASPAPGTSSPPGQVSVNMNFTEVSSTCSRDVAWESARVREWLALSQQFQGHVQPCLDLYRQADADDSADYYVAVARVAWSVDSRQESWWPFDKVTDDAGTLKVSLAFVGPSPVMSNVYEGSNPAFGDCAPTIEDYASTFVPPWQTDVPTVLVGSCEGRATRTEFSDAQVVWNFTRPEQWDLTLTSYSFKVANGVVPNVALTVTPAQAR